MKNQLDGFRKQIDEIDVKIINLLAKRLAVVREVGKFKKEKGIPPLDQDRWQKVLVNKLEKAKVLGINPNLVKKIYEAIHEEALKIEEKIKI